jgi:hypothetical protein
MSVGGALSPNARIIPRTPISFRFQALGLADRCYASLGSGNRKGDRKELRLKEHRSGKCKRVVVMRERNGRSLPHVRENFRRSMTNLRFHKNT